MPAEVNVLATFSHYYDHMAPIIDALRDRGHRVNVYSGQQSALWGPYIHPSDIERLGRKLWMVAASVDSARTLGQHLIYVEHGAGQTYLADERGDTAGYSSGRMDDAVMFLCPNVFVMNRRRENHHGVPSMLVGSPKMDQFYRGLGHDGVQSDVVALAWHWNCGVTDESLTAWPHYQPWLNRYVLGCRRAGIRVVGHAHPRIAKRARYHYERHGIEWWDHDQVLNEAGMLCVDNSSIGYEFASLDRPVLWLNAPWYRRHVHHGLRFWEYVPGEQIDGIDADEWVEATARVLRHDVMGERRRDVNDRVFPLRDGNSALRAAMAIETLL